MPSFSTQQNQKPSNYFLSQPHQAFFLFGVIFAIVSMLIFALGYKGIVPTTVNVVSFHAYALIFMVFTQFFTGFLFTTFPRFNQTDVIDKALYTKVMITLESGSIGVITGLFISPYLYLGSMLIVFSANIMIVKTLFDIYQNAKAPDKSDSYWILMGFYAGLLAHIVFIVGTLSDVFGYSVSWLGTAATIGIINYLVFVTFSVGQRMVPFFSHCFFDKFENFVKIVFVLLVVKSLLSIMQIPLAEAGVNILLALFIAKELYRWKLPFRTSPPILWVLHLALFWLPLALFLGGVTEIGAYFLQTSFAFSTIHLLSIGFVTTMLIGFGTRVTLGHSGQPPHGDTLARNIFVFVQVVVLVRFLYSLQLGLDWSAFWLFDLSFTAWLILFIVWAWRYGPVLVSGKKLG